MTTLTVAERDPETTTRSTVSTVRGEYESRDPGDTEKLGAELASRLAAGDVVLVEGEIGAGKTTFVRGACRALGIRGPVTSPTFTIGQRYRGRVAVSHLDLFRVPGLAGDHLVQDGLRVGIAAQLAQGACALERLPSAAIQARRSR